VARLFDKHPAFTPIQHTRILLESRFFSRRKLLDQKHYWKDVTRFVKKQGRVPRVVQYTYVYV
jgi:hypothetical protein